MGILDRINEKNVGAIAGAEQEQQQTANQTDAAETSKQHRQGYSDSYRQFRESTNVKEVPAGAEEQAQFTKMEQAATEIISSMNPGATEELLKAVMSAEDPVQGIGLVAADIVQRVSQENPGATEEALLSLGESSVNQIVELVEMANPRIDLTEEQMSEALSIGVQSYTKSNPDLMDEDAMRGFIANG